MLETERMPWDKDEPSDEPFFEPADEAIDDAFDESTGEVYEPHSDTDAPREYTYEPFPEADEGPPTDFGLPDDEKMAGWVLRNIAAILGRDPLEVLNSMEEIRDRRAEIAAQVNGQREEVAFFEHRRKVVLAIAEDRIRRDYAGKAKNENGVKLTESAYDNLARISPEYQDFMKEYRAMLDVHKRDRKQKYVLDNQFWNFKNLFDYLLKAIDWGRAESYAATK